MNVWERATKLATPTFGIRLWKQTHGFLSHSCFLMTKIPFITRKLPNLHCHQKQESHNSSSPSPFSSAHAPSTQYCPFSASSFLFHGFFYIFSASLSVLVHLFFTFCFSAPHFHPLRETLSLPSPDCHFRNFMGNCLSDSKKLTAEIVPQELIKGRPASTAPAVRLYGSPTDNLTSYIRFALLYKSVKLSFVPSETPNFGSETPAIQFGSETVSGSRETMLQYIEARFPHPPLKKLKKIDDDDETSTLKVVRLTEMQHRSIIWHAERITRWAEDLATRGGKRTVDPSLGSPRMEIRKFGKSYSQLLEVMLEHAQMEERVLFPVLDMADRGICKGANEEHARDLPMMNGIKEYIKSIGVLDSGSSLYHEALADLSKRLKALQGHYKQHMAEEEKNLLPLMEAAEVSREKEEKMVKEIMNVMQGTHSHLLNFLLEGLLPEEAMDYLDFIST